MPFLQEGFIDLSAHFARAATGVAVFQFPKDNMRNIYVIVVLVMGCSSGQQGPQGIQGEKGDQGPIGPQGPAGFSAISVATVSTGVSCDAGGVAILDNDGGQLFICNGQKGETGPKGDVGANGPQGLQGEVGPQGIQGLSARGPTLYAPNNQMIGKFTYSMSGDNKVFREDYDCESYVDFKMGVVRPIANDIYFTDVGCNGTPLMAFGSNNFTLCVGNSNYTYKATQPITMIDANLLSRRYFSSFSDGGVTDTCTTFTDPFPNTNLVIWEPMQYTNISGPFTIGHN